MMQPEDTLRELGFLLRADGESAHGGSVTGGQRKGNARRGSCRPDGRGRFVSCISDSHGSYILMDGY
jgi:hypothetical protein